MVYLRRARVALASDRAYLEQSDSEEHCASDRTRCRNVASGAADRARGWPAFGRDLRTLGLLWNCRVPRNGARRLGGMFLMRAGTL